MNRRNDLNLRKVTAPITIIYNFDGICSYSDQYNHFNAQYLVDNALFDLKNDWKYDIIMINSKWG